MLPAWAQRITDLLASDPQKSASGLARACGIKPGSVSGWLGGGKPTKMISGDNLVSAAAYLGTTPEFIMTGAKVPVDKHSQPLRLDPEIVRDVARALQEVYEEDLGRVYSIIDEPELFVEMYERTVARGVADSRSNMVWLGARIGSAQQGAQQDESKGLHGESHAAAKTGRRRAKG